MQLFAHRINFFTLLKDIIDEELDEFNLLFVIVNDMILVCNHHFRESVTELGH